MIKIITGVHRPDRGSLFLDGNVLELSGPRSAISRGIGVVHQERNLIPRFSVGENIFVEQLGEHLLHPIDYDRINVMAKHWLDELALDLDPRTPVSELSVAKMQIVEIAKALSLKSRVLLLDEPTASLTGHETATLFALLRKLKAEGVSMLFVSHKLEEVQEICDQVTVLRDGVNACDSQPMQGLARQDLVRLMIGRGEQFSSFQARNRSNEPPMLELHDVATTLGHRDINLAIGKGEIVGLYGLVGAGRSELAKATLGAYPIAGGQIRIDGKAVAIRSVADAIHNHRIGYVSEDRKQEGLILLHSVLENVGITIWRRLATRLGLLADGTVATETRPLIGKLDIRTPSLNQAVGNLSGGNQQKVSLAKWLAAGVRILIVDEPSVGIDIKTKVYLHQLLRELASQGTAILLITSDMPEMIAVADRIVVMNAYRTVGEITNTGNYDQISEAIMQRIHEVEPDWTRNA